MDSLNIELAKAKTDTGKISILSRLVNACDIKENLKYASPIVDLTDKLLLTAKDSVYKEKLLKSRSYAVHAIIYYYTTIEGKQSAKIAGIYNQHISICKKHNYITGIVDSYDSMADMYNGLGEPMKKLNCLKEGYEYMKRLNDKKGQAKFIMRLAFFYSQFGDTAQALEYAQKGEKLELEIADSSRISRGYVLRGAFYISVKRYEDALKNLIS